VHDDSFVQPDAEVMLQAEVIDAQARFSPSQLDFGKIEVGTQVMQALTVTNDSPLPVTVTPTAQGPDAAAFQSSELVVPAHTTKQMGVTFSPSKVAKMQSALSITRCRGCEADTVTLYGEGIDSAMVVDPSPLDFGSVPVDGAAEVDCRLINVSSLPLELKGVALDSASDDGFTLLQQVPDTVLPPGGWLATGVRFSPTHMGAARGNLVVSSSSRRHPSLAAPLVAGGGGAEVAVSPEALDLGDVPVGAMATGVVHVRNAGTNGDVLTVSGASLSGSSAMRLRPVSFPVQLSAGQALDLTVDFQPSAAGAAQATLTVDSSDGSLPHSVVTVSGNGLATAPCQFSLLPATIDFGNVAPGGGAVLGLRFSNEGGDLCAVGDVHIESDANGAFSMPGGALASLVLWPGDSFQTQVAFVPNAAGQVTGQVQMQVNDPAQPTVSLPLIGASYPACLAAAPPYIDFGPLRRDCSHAPRSTHVVNACSAPIDVGAVWIGEGTSDEFSIAGAPATPLSLAPGAGFNVSVQYAAQEQGQNFSPLWLNESDVPQAPLLVPLLGEGMPDGKMVDTFVQGNGTKADVLFLVDNSNSMAEEQPRLAAAIPAFIQAARQNGMDLHAAVTTTGIDPVVEPGCGGGANGGEAGRLFPVDGSMPRIINLGQAAPEQALQGDIAVGLCHHLEQTLEAMRRALSSPLVDHADDPATALPNDGNEGFLRSDAQLSVVAVTDEDDHSGDPVNDYATFLRSVHGLTQPQRAGFFAIAPLSSCPSSSGSSAPRLSQMAQATGGQVWDVCNGDYSAALSAIAERSFGAQTRFPLTRPADASSVQVLLDGQPAAPGSWSFDAGTNSVDFASAPAAGTSIEVDYKQLCP